MSLSLWLMPEGALYESLGGLITDLARRHGGPAFAPHVTLLGSVGTEEQAMTVARELVETTPPLEIRLGAVGHGDEYFRCLYFEVLPDAWLLNAYRRAAALAGPATRPPFSPHLSLAYGRLSTEQREAILLDTRTELVGLFGTSFTGFSLHLFRTDGEPSGWRRVARFPFVGRG